MQNLNVLPLHWTSLVFAFDEHDELGAECGKVGHDIDDVITIGTLQRGEVV